MSKTSWGAIIALIYLLFTLTSSTAHAQSRLQTDGAPGPIFHIDYLYWGTQSPAVEYGISDIGGVQDRGPVGDVLKLDTKFDRGVRLGLGWRLGPQTAGPEFRYTYTQFDTNMQDEATGAIRATFISSDNSENDDSDNINTLGVETIFPDDRATRAQATLDFDYTTHDWGIAQSLILSDELTLRLSGTGRYARFHHLFDATYTGGDFQTQFNAFENNTFEGGGILMGLDLTWYVFRGLSVQVGGNGGLMMGLADYHIFIPDDEPGFPTNVTNSEMRILPIIDVSAGFNYARVLGPVELNFGAGFELVHWFNLIDTRVFSDSHQEAQNIHQRQDISLGGAYIRFGVNL